MSASNGNPDQPNTVHFSWDKYPVFLFSCFPPSDLAISFVLCLVYMLTCMVRAVSIKIDPDKEWMCMCCYYSRTSMARTSLGPWKFVRDTISSSH